MWLPGWTAPGAKIPFSRISPLTEREKEALKEYIQESLKKGFTQPSTSPAGAGIFFVASAQTVWTPNTQAPLIQRGYQRLTAHPSLSKPPDPCLLSAPCQVACLWRGRGTHTRENWWNSCINWPSGATKMALWSTHWHEALLSSLRHHTYPHYMAIHRPRTSPAHSYLHQVPPAADSPAEARIRLDFPGPELHDRSQQPVTQGSQGSQSDPIASYPTIGQAVMDNTLKEMLMSLRSSFQGDKLTLFQNFDHTFTALDNRMSHVEMNMGAIASTVNDLVDTHTEEHWWIKDKLSNIEDRSYRNNLKICGVPESVLKTCLHTSKNCFKL